MEGEIDSSTIIGDFSTSLSIMDRSSRQKIRKEIAGLTLGSSVLSAAKIQIQ